MREKLKRIPRHKVEYEGSSGATHWFKVLSSNSGESYDVRVDVTCCCKYGSVKGIPNGKLCSHVMSVMKHMFSDDTSLGKKGGD